MNKNKVLIIFLFLGWISFGQVSYTNGIVKKIKIDNIEYLSKQKREYTAFNSIEIAPNFKVQIKSDASLKTQTGNEIIINPGFEVENGGHYLAEINPAINFKKQEKSTKDDTYIERTNGEYIYSVNKENYITTFPNPTNGIVTLNIKNFKEKYRVEVFDMNGNRMNDFETKGEHFKLDLSEFNPGLFLVKVTNQKNIFTTRIMKIK